MQRVRRWFSDSFRPGRSSPLVEASVEVGNSERDVLMDSVVFLVDVDETLINNDAVCEDLKQQICSVFGEEAKRRYWELFEELWTELGYADYLGALQRYRLEHLGDPRLSCIASYLLQYPFSERLYPGALETIAALRQRAPVVVLSDGDAVHQPNKIERSGIRAAVDGHVLIYIHKEEMLDDVARRYPAERYVMVDDKLRILSAIKAVWHDRVTTVFVRQGHYALDPAIVRSFPAADVTIERIADLQGLQF
jgi:FMN phosphatase YigB (HAD superfamily)